METDFGGWTQEALALYKELMDFERKGNASIANKVNQISMELGVVKKDGTNTYSNYSFTGHEHMTSVLKPLLIKHKLGLRPYVESVHETNFSTTDDRGKTKTTIRTVVTGGLILIDIETGYERKVPFCGADQDVGGKSYGQAVTEMQKRAEFKLFHVTDKASVDPDSKTTEITGMDALTWIRQHEELKKICSARRLSSKTIEVCVVDGQYDVQKVKDELEKA